MSASFLFFFFSFLFSVIALLATVHYQRLIATMQNISRACKWKTRNFRHGCSDFSLIFSVKKYSSFLGKKEEMDET
jgi:hypothetical protein